MASAPILTSFGWQTLTAQYTLGGAFLPDPRRNWSHAKKCSSVALGGTDEIFDLNLWDPAINAELDKGNISPTLKDEMIMHGALLSDDITVSVQNPGREWKLTDRVWERNYIIKANASTRQLKIHAEIIGLRGIFASDDWIGSIERLKAEPENFLNSGCYIATLNGSPFIEDGLRKTTEKSCSSIVYGILNED